MIWLHWSKNNTNQHSKQLEAKRKLSKGSEENPFTKNENKCIKKKMSEKGHHKEGSRIPPNTQQWKEKNNLSTKCEENILNMYYIPNNVLMTFDPILDCAAYHDLLFLSQAVRITHVWWNLERTGPFSFRRKHITIFFALVELCIVRWWKAWEKVTKNGFEQIWFRWYYHHY